MLTCWVPFDLPIREHPKGKRDDRIDAYIARSAKFARPILTHQAGHEA